MKTAKEAAIKSETEIAVDAYLAECGVTYAVTATGKGIKRESGESTWECDGWRVTLVAKNGASAEFEYFSGTGHRIRSIDQDRVKFKYPGLTENDKRGVTSYGRRYRAEWEAAARPFPPFAASVLYCLFADGNGALGQSFANWCGDYGYDSDSIRALKTYQECQQTGDKLARLFNAEQRAHLSELLQDY